MVIIVKESWRSPKIICKAILIGFSRADRLHRSTYLYTCVGNRHDGEIHESTYRIDVSLCGEFSKLL